MLKCQQLLEFEHYEQDKFRAELSWAWIYFYNLGARLLLMKSPGQNARRFLWCLRNQWKLWTSATKMAQNQRGCGSLMLAEQLVSIYTHYIYKYSVLFVGWPPGAWGIRKEWLFLGSWGALLIILGDLGSKLIVFRDLGSPAKTWKVNLKISP